jgi:H+/Cl- antiporter ClcA
VRLLKRPSYTTLSNHPLYKVSRIDPMSTKKVYCLIIGLVIGLAGNLASRTTTHFQMVESSED